MICSAAANPRAGGAALRVACVQNRPAIHRGVEFQNYIINALNAMLDFIPVIPYLWVLFF